VSPLRGLTVAQVRAVVAAATRRQVPAGTTLCAAGTPGDAAHFVLDGAVAIGSAPGASRRFDLGGLGLAAGIGTEALLGEPYATTVTADSDATVLILRTGDLDALAGRDPVLGAALRQGLRSA
jgi:CRP-like cAMP-binding protein